MFPGRRIGHVCDSRVRSSLLNYNGYAVFINL
jgi:hypothetical protein